MDPDTLFQAARQAHDAEDWPRAAILWEQARSVLRDHPLTYTLGAVALREAGDLEGAEVVIEEGLVRCPEFHGCYMVWADLAMRRHDWPEAAMRWAAVRLRFPKDGQGYVHGAHVFTQLARLDDADQVLEEGRQTLPHDPWVMATWGYFAQHHRDTEEALRRFAIVRRQVPNHPAGYVSAALTLREFGRYQEAEAILAGALARFPNDSGPVIDFAAIAQARGDHEEAIDRWRIVRDRFPDQGSGYAGGAAVLHAAGRPDEAEALIATALERLPNNPHLHFKYGWAANTRGDWPEAERRWAAIRARFPGEWLPYVENAKVLAALERPDDADAVIAEGRRRFPGELGVATAWADLAIRRRDWPEAAARWHIVREQFPNDMAAVTEGSRALLDAGCIDDAEAMLAEAMRRFPDNVIIARVWAEIATRREIWPEAAGRWERVRQRFPDQVIAYAEGARALRQSGLEGEANALLDDAASRFPFDPSIRFAWAVIASSRNDWIEANRRWDVVRNQFPDEIRPWIEGAAALSHMSNSDEADALLERGRTRHPASFEMHFNWALQAARFKSPVVAHDRWRYVRETFPDHAIGYTFGALALQDAGRSVDAEALIADAATRFPNSAEVMRDGAEIAARRGELAVAADRFANAAHLNPRDQSIARRLIETLDALKWHDKEHAALDNALRLWPRDRDFLVRRTMLDIRAGRFDSARALWRSIIAQPDLPSNLGPSNLGFELAWAIYREGPPPDIAHELLLFLLREPDTGARHWLPVVAGMIHLRGPRPELAELTQKILADADDLPCDTATRDVLRCALLHDVSDDDIRRYLRDYAGKGRVALTAHLFCQNYWKAKQGAFKRFTAVFEEYLAEKWADLSWLRADNATEVLGYLNFAAVQSDRAYTDIVRAMRQHLDLEAMRGQGLQTIQGVAANIALTASIDAPAIVSASRPLRVAICVSGQLRGFVQAVPTWENLHLERHDVSIYVDVWKTIGRNWERLWNFTRAHPELNLILVGPNGLPFLRDRYPRFAAAAWAPGAESDEADAAMVRGVFNTEFVRIEDDAADELRGRHPLWKMPYKIERAHRLALEEGREFDLMIRMRPDRAFLPGPVPDWHAIHAYSRDSRALFADVPFTFTERQTWLGDQYAVGTQAVMDVYSTLHTETENYIRTGGYPVDVPDHIRPHTNLFYQCFYRGVIGRPMPDVLFGPLLDRTMLTPAEVLALVRQDIAGRSLDDLDTQMLAACEVAAGSSHS